MSLTDDSEFVSVVMPVYNAGDTLREALVSLTEQDYPSRLYEVIIVDDGSVDGSDKIAEQFGIILIKQRHQGSGAARNLGINRAQGDVIILLDADCVAGRDWISRHVRARRSSQNAACIGGVFAFPEKGSRFIELCDYYSCWYEQHERMPYSSGCEYLPSTNLSFYRRRALEIGGFNVNLATGEDVDFCWRMKEKGGGVILNPGIVVKHYPRRSIKSFLGHHYRWGYHGINVRRWGSGKRYSFLFRANVAWAICLSMPIATGYTLYIFVRWLRFIPLRVFVFLPMIFLAKISYSWGVVRGTAEYVQRQKFCG